MKREYGHIRRMVWMSLAGLLLLTACSSSDETTRVEMKDGVQVVKAQFNFSLPLKKSTTRMGGDVVQESETEEDFRDMTDVRLLCFDAAPSESSSMIGGVIEMKTSGREVYDEATENDYSLCQEIKIPLGTSHFGFYARANDAPTTHEQRMKYGVIETVGLGNGSYQDNSDIRFRPVQLCTSDKPLGGSAIGQRLLNMLNELMDITGPEAAPNDKWSTVNNMYLNEAYQRMTQLTTLSSYNVQTMLATINKIASLKDKFPDNQGMGLADAIVAKIASYCTTAPTPTSETISLKEEYMGFPADLHLPAGAARIMWDDTKSSFVVPEAQDYGNGLSVASINDYVYPMNLQYQIFSDIVASDNMVIKTEEGTPDNQYEDWESLLEQGYAGASKKVEETTQSVAMVHQVEYAVGRMALRTKLKPYVTIRDANGDAVDTSNGYTLTGYLIGGQREVDYNFQPVAGSRKYAIYDTDINGGPQTVDDSDFTGVNYILGLGTDPNETVRLALELVNDGQAFQGADGVIASGATFYLVVELDPSQATTTNFDKIFDRDFATQVNLTISSLASATYGLPNLDIPHPTVGISVNLTWEDGLTYEEEL